MSRKKYPSDRGHVSTARHVSGRVLPWPFGELSFDPDDRIHFEPYRVCPVVGEGLAATAPRGPGSVFTRHSGIIRSTGQKYGNVRQYNGCRLHQEPSVWNGLRYHRLSTVCRSGNTSSGQQAQDIRHQPIDFNPAIYRKCRSHPKPYLPPGSKRLWSTPVRANLRHIMGKQVEGAVVLMELDSGRNWEYAATMGAHAIIYVDRGNSPNILFKDKFELSPIQFPRFWMPLEQARNLFGLFENPDVARVADQVTLTSDIRWQEETAQNIYCLIPGVDPELQHEMVMLEAFYDSSVNVAGRSPGADEACSVATLLKFAGILKEKPTQKIGAASRQCGPCANPSGHAGVYLGPI